MGYLGHQQLTVPPRKHPGRDRTPGEKAAASSIAKIRWAVEPAIAHLKSWRILSHRYRGPLDWLPTVVYTVASIKLFRTWR